MLLHILHNCKKNAWNGCLWADDTVKLAKYITIRYIAYFTVVKFVVIWVHPYSAEILISIPYTKKNI